MRLFDKKINGKTMMVLWDSYSHRAVFTIFAKSANIDDMESFIRFCCPRYTIVDVLEEDFYKTEENLKHQIDCRFGNLNYITHKQLGL